MTVSAQTPINRSVGNGVTTVFPYNFKVLSAADMEVSVDGVVKTLTTHYTLSGVGSDSGDVTFLTPPDNMAVVVRRRNMAYTRSVDYQDQGELPTDTLDDDQDAPVLMIQQVAEELGRSIRVSPESSGVDLELPTPTALNYLRWNAVANALENVLLADVSLISLTAYAQTLLNAMDAAAARLVLGTTTVGSALFTAASVTAARLSIGAAASGPNNDITSLDALPVSGPGLVPVGAISAFGGGSAPTGWLVCPTAQTNISRTAYAKMFAVYGVTWGAGDGSTTFGMPWCPPGHVFIQANGNVGTFTTGQVVSHTHGIGITNIEGSGSSGAQGAGNLANSTVNTASSGGSANLPAGAFGLYIVKY